MNMPIALVIFGDKSHLDLHHGSLLTLPIIFTLSCFNQKSRIKEEFWWPLAFLPNLSYGALSSKNSKKPSMNSYQDEHDCLHAAFSSHQKIHKKGGMAVAVMGKQVVGKVWIHFCIGDSQGNNPWLGQYNGSGNLNHPCQDCNCHMWDIDKLSPICQYITQNDYFTQKLLIDSCTTETAKKDVCKSFSKHHIINAFMDKTLPLSNLLHGIYCMTPLEQLHTTSEGLTKYMIESVCNTIGDVGEGKRPLNKIEKLHHTLHFDLKRNSEHDFPRGFARYGALKLQSLYHHQTNHSYNFSFPIYFTSPCFLWFARIKMINYNISLPIYFTSPHFLWFSWIKLIHYIIPKSLSILKNTLCSKLLLTLTTII